MERVKIVKDEAYLQGREANSRSKLDLICMRNILPMHSLPRALPNLILVSIMFLGILGRFAFGLRTRESEIVGRLLTHTALNQCTEAVNRFVCVRHLSG